MKTFYDIAFLEDEGLGTAYEYYVKRKFLERIIKMTGDPKKICIFGLPQKFGLSMDFCLLASDYKSDVTVIEERDISLNRFEEVLNVLKKNKIISDINLTKNNDLKDKNEYDLLLNTEVMHKYSDDEIKKIIEKTADSAKITIYFIPNPDNVNRIKSSNSQNLKFNELIKDLKDKYEIIEYGYMDMPPFPSGVKMSNTDKGKMKKAETFMILVFLFLKIWSLWEKILPSFIKKKFAHVSYVAIMKK